MIQPQELLSFNGTDCVILTVIGVSTLISLVRGFLKELISLFVWVIGFWVAIKLYTTVAALLAPHIANDAIRQVVSFAAIFLLVLILGSLFNYLFSFIIIKSGLSGTDRLLGMFFGCARGMLLVAVVLLLISTTSFVHDEWWKKSVLIPHMYFLTNWLSSFLPQKMVSIAGVIH